MTIRPVRAATALACAAVLVVAAACSSSGGSGGSSAAAAPAGSSSASQAASSAPAAAPSQAASSAASAAPSAAASGSAAAGSGAAASGPAGTNTTAADSPAAAAVAAIKSDPTLAAALPAAMQKNGINVATSVPYPPMEMFAKDGKTPIGVDPDLARAIGNRIGVKVNVINVNDFNAQLPGVLTGRYDMVMSSMTDTKERQGKVDFVDYVSDGQGFLVKGGNPENIKTPMDMCGKTIAVVDNGSALALGEELSSECTAAGKQAIKILKFTGDSDALLQVRSGRATADIDDFPVAAYQAATSKGALDVVEIPGHDAPLGIGIKPSNDALIKTVQAALNSMIQDGTYANVLKAWNVSGMALTSATINAGK